MALTQDQRDRLVGFMNHRLRAAMPCQLCGTPGPWTVSDNIWEVREFSSGGLKVGGPIYPVLAVTCTTCGNTLFVNAIVAGVLVPQDHVEAKP
jgi:hypothetical protein